MKFRKLIPGLIFFMVSNVMAAQVTVVVQSLATDQPETLGTITFTDSEYGLMIEPKLKNLPPGPHGFHLHVNPSCEHKGAEAGGHFDPEETNQHLGPFNDKGHLGDMPVLWVDGNGLSVLPMIAPRLSVEDLSGHAVIIHAGGDNYSDEPKKLGGGGARIACGIIAAKKKPSSDAKKAAE